MLGLVNLCEHKASLVYKLSSRTVKGYIEKLCLGEKKRRRGGEGRGEVGRRDIL